MGVNDFIEQDEKVEIPILIIDESVEKEQVKELARIKSSRDNDKVKRSLADLKKAAMTEENHMPPLLECVRCYTTEEEITSTLREVYGEYHEPPMI